MTLLFFLRPKNDHYDPGMIGAFEAIKKRYEKKLKIKKKIKVEDESLALAPVAQLGAERVNQSEVVATGKVEDTSIQQVEPILDYYDAELLQVVQVRNKILGLQAELTQKAWADRMRRIAMHELAIRVEIARLKQEEEDEVIVMFLMHFIE